MTQYRGAIDLSTLSSAPSSPASGYLRMYPKSDNRLYMEDSGSSEMVVGHPGGFTPADHGALSWSYDFCMSTTGFVIVAGTIYLIGQQVSRSATATTIWWCNQTAGSGLTAGQCWVALLNSSGTVLATVDASSNSAINLQSVTFTGVALTPGFYWTAFLFNGTTPPRLAQQGTISGAVNNFNRTDATARFATNGTLQTTITNRTPASNTKMAQVLWAALG